MCSTQNKGPSSSVYIAEADASEFQGQRARTILYSSCAMKCQAIRD